ncbi:TetR family transcriptional regulator [Sphingobium fuliginis]|jgi:AcrR family transcriptional regulator|uniref:TetR family transcriptional regulator n=2 Tax=Sphingobium fuliginis (strain ATCC 27551) TaxID=336203 RepID=A0A7M2GD20_SPHSA|nr:TetR/AcrR family transcriptional regulator [Sphingobium fuliginis]QOT70453.1 TetR family transcriptional regulator [Sphingobium fuliginis]
MAQADNGRTRILDSAAAVLRQKGLAGAKLSEIAQRAGMLAPSIYHHFPSKDHLVEEVMMEGIYRNNRHIMARVEGLGAATAPIVRLRAAIVAHVDFLLTGDDYSSAVSRIFDDLPEEMRKRVLAAYSSFDNYWRDLIVAAQADGSASQALDATVVRKFLIAMLDSCASWYRPGKLGPMQIAEQAADLLLNGFAAERP